MSGLPPDIERLVVRDKSSGRFHEAVRLYGREPMLHDACNFQGEREYMSDLPDDVQDQELCKRCFGRGE